MSNQYVSELARMLASRYSVESAGMTTGEWMCANTKVRGNKFSFTGYEFQKAIADDLHPDLSVIKISQVGLTEVQMRKSVSFLIRNPGTSGIFSLPNEMMYRRFSQSRLKPMIEENRVFKPTLLEAPVRSMDLMQFGMSFLNVVNATEGSATSIPADFVFMDEVDLSDQKILALFSSRLQNSNYKIKQGFSTPSWAGFGIDSTFTVSDQREYVIKCSACNTHQVPDFSNEHVYIPGLPDSMDVLDIDEEVVDRLNLDAAFVMCKQCGSPLDLDDTRREWIASYPSRTARRGYRVSPFSCARITIPYIVGQLLDYRRRDFLRGFYNTVIGRAYSDAKARLSQGQVRQCLGAPTGQEVSSTVPVFLGMDMGATVHMVLGTPTPSGVHVFEFRSFPVEQVESVVREVTAQYNLINGCVDRHPYTPTANALRALTDGKIMPVEYRGDASLKPIKNIEGDITHFQANRTGLLDAVANRVRQGTYRFEGYGLQGAVLTTHLMDQVREETPESPAKWVKLTGQDHYSHALAFMEAALKMRDVLDAVSNADTRSTLVFSGIRVPLFNT